MASLSDLDSSWGDFADHFGASCGTWGTLWGQIGVTLQLFSSNFGAKSLENVRIVASMRLSLFVYCFCMHKSSNLAFFVPGDTHIYMDKLR